MKLIVGLGNPGKAYELTRHNIGQMSLGRLSFYNQLSWKSKFDGEVSSWGLVQEKVCFLRPMTFMNRSGESVQKASSFYKIPRENILIVHDELDIPFGTMVFKNGGGSAGHNGLKSVVSELGGDDFKRLRLGIGRPTGENVSPYVLGPFGKEELPHLEKFLQVAAQAIEAFAQRGMDWAAKTYSRKNILAET